MIKILHGSILFVLLMAGCSKPERNGAESPEVASREEAIAVEVVTAVRRPFHYRIAASGTVQSESDIKVYGRTGGAVSKVSCVNGRIVAGGSRIVELESGRQQLAVERAGVNLAEKMIAFKDQMLGYGYAVDTVRYREAIENIRLTSGLAAAEVAYKEAKLDLENTVIRSPIAGKVSDCFVKVGEYITADRLICRVYNPSQFVVECDVLEEDAAIISVGMPAEVTPLSDGNRKLSGKLVEINPRVDENTKMVRVKVRVSDQNLIPGMAAEITLMVPSETQVIVPKEAVVLRSGRPVIFTEEKGMAKWNYVKLGRENGREVEVVEGLPENARVVITNNLQLAHDSHITPIKP